MRNSPGPLIVGHVLWRGRSETDTITPGFSCTGIHMYVCTDVVGVVRSFTGVCAKASEIDILPICHMFSVLTACVDNIFALFSLF